VKKLPALFAALWLSALTVQPVLARTCPKLIKEGRDLLAHAKFSKADADKVSTLLDDSEKAHESGDHNTSMKKAREALSLLGKK